MSPTQKTCRFTPSLLQRERGTKGNHPEALSVGRLKTYYFFYSRSSSQNAIPSHLHTKNPGITISVGQMVPKRGFQALFPRFYVSCFPELLFSNEFFRTVKAGIPPGANNEGCLLNCDIPCFECKFVTTVVVLEI
ncbi:hypothetical protein CDAR_169441 [Caerostris darwini]|uniref:Uncharacterized protein n=1 Tax=Caerostris darwini TaxID=1538125 RepID=A0AAV4QLB3_9ARAC|nr:hypothetical protein CDAR_169441 [Caerostris darwini]